MCVLTVKGCFVSRTAFLERAMGECYTSAQTGELKVESSGTYSGDWFAFCADLVAGYVTGQEV